MTILVNSREYLAEFIALNEAWIQRNFKLEAIDQALANNPGKIIDDGGYIFTLMEGPHVVGTCALFRDDAETYQLARMAVDPRHQGKGYGNTLITAAIDKLHGLNAKRVYLLSNTLLTPAIALYQKHGFTIQTEGQHPEYARCNIVMEKCL